MSTVLSRSSHSGSACVTATRTMDGEYSVLMVRLFAEVRGMEIHILLTACCGMLTPSDSVIDRVMTAIYLSELRRDFLASIGITYAVFRIAKSRLRAFGEIC